MNQFWQKQPPMSNFKRGLLVMAGLYLLGGFLQQRRFMKLWQRNMETTAFVNNANVYAREIDETVKWMRRYR